MEILGIKIEPLSRSKILSQIEKFLSEENFHRVTTVNPEFLVKSEGDNVFKQNLKQSDLAVADGFGITLVGMLCGKKVIRFAGADLVLDILRIAEEKRYSIFLAINKTGLSSYEEVRAAILEKYPNLKVNGLDLNPIILNPPFVISENIVLCNYGVPEQEYFVQNLRSVGQGVRLAMGVGGSFDYLTGKVKRAPLWMRNIGLEWLWRLFLQPRRFKRILDAVFIFPWKVLSCRRSGKIL